MFKLQMVRRLILEGEKLAFFVFFAIFRRVLGKRGREVVRFCAFYARFGVPLFLG